MHYGALSATSAHCSSRESAEISSGTPDMPPIKGTML
jgi:hypothetical protein